MYHVHHLEFQWLDLLLHKPQFARTKTRTFKRTNQKSRNTLFLLQLKGFANILKIIIKMEKIKIGGASKWHSIVTIKLGWHFL